MKRIYQLSQIQPLFIYFVFGYAPCPLSYSQEVCLSCIPVDGHQDNVASVPLLRAIKAGQVQVLNQVEPWLIIAFAFLECALTGVVTKDAKNRPSGAIASVDVILKKTMLSAIAKSERSRRGEEH